jgi:hypothetical protein
MLTLGRPTAGQRRAGRYRPVDFGDRHHDTAGISVKTRRNHFGNLFMCQLLRVDHRGISWRELQKGSDVLCTIHVDPVIHYVAGLSGFLIFSQSRDRPDRWRAHPLRHDALKAHRAGLPVYRGAVIGGVRGQHDAERAPAHQPPKPLLPVAQRQAAERSSPSSSSRSNAYSIASLTVPRRCRSLNTATPSGPQTQASPSSVNDWARSFVAVTAIAGYRLLQS